MPGAGEVVEADMSMNDFRELKDTEKRGMRMLGAKQLRHELDTMIEKAVTDQVAKRWTTFSPKMGREERVENAKAIEKMVCKYVRELSMELFNRFWQNHIPDLRPTKGYPADAKRFHSEIAETQQKLGIENNTLWRER